MEDLAKNVGEVLYKKFLEIKDLPDIDMEIEKIFRDIRWREPELGIYVKKKMRQFLKEKGNP